MPTTVSHRVTTVAGTGDPGYSGDGGAALAASLNEPKHVAVDRRGALYVADAENHVIRKVDLTTGIITTIAGFGETTPASSPAAGGGAWPTATDGEDDPLADSPAHGTERFAQIRDQSGTVRFVVGTRKDGRFAGDAGAAAKATLNFPSAVAVDAAGHLYVADTMNHRIRKMDAETGLVSTVAGNGHRRYSGDGGPGTEAALNEPVCVAVDDRRQRLYIADQSNNRVRILDLRTGIISNFAGTGEAAYHGDGLPAVEACLSGPSGLAVGSEGEVYIADTFNGRIRRVDPERGIIATVVGDGGEYRYDGQSGEFSTSLSRPYGIALESDGSLLITDSDSHLIRRWHKNRKIITLVAGNGVAQFSGDGVAPEVASLSYPFGVAVDARGVIYVADTFNHRVRRIGP